jgi:hypothetical protein
MTRSRIPSILGAAAISGLLLATTNGAQAARTPSAPVGSSHGSSLGSSHGPAHGQAAPTVRQADHFQAPVPHRYGTNGMRMGMHCETTDMS